MSESVFDPDQLGVEAYLYLYPLVTMEVSRRQMTNSAAGKIPGRAPMGVGCSRQSRPNYWSVWRRTPEHDAASWQPSQRANSIFAHSGGSPPGTRDNNVWRSISTR